MTTNPRVKGNRYMVRVCRALSVWWGIEDALSARAVHLPFRQRSTSIQPIEGHWEGAGDILHRPDLSPGFPFCVECKDQEKGRMDAILEAPRWPVWDWWDQTKKQAEKVSLSPLLVFTRNRRKDYALLLCDDARALGVAPCFASVLEVRRPRGEEITLCLLDDLIQVPPEEAARLLVR